MSKILPYLVGITTIGAFVIALLTFLGIGPVSIPTTEESKESQTLTESPVDQAGKIREISNLTG